MIHIDRNNTKQDIILQNDKMISWDDHFDQDPFISHLDTTQHHPGPVETTHDSPTSTRGRSSSLSPVPDPSPQPHEKEAPLQIPVREEEEEDENENEAVPTAINEASRLSTPLSELSPPPDQDEAPDGDTQKPSSSPKPEVSADTNDTQPTTTNGSKSEATKEDPGNGSSNTSQPALTAPGVSSSSSLPQPIQTPAVQEPSDQTSPSTSPASPEKAGPSMPSHSPTNINGTSLSPTSTSSTPNFIQQAQDAALLNPSPGDPKVELVLELNLELLKILIALQGKGVLPSDARFQQYAQRIQSNLGWMASSADYHRLGGQIVQAQTSQGKHSKGPIHPIIEPPAFIEFGSDRIRQIYSELPKTFSKEINLRQQLAANVAVPANPLHAMVPGNLKRDRSDEPISEMMSSKRRDTGEGKMRPPSLSPLSHSASGMMPPPSSIPQQQQQLNPTHGVTLPAATHFSLPMSTSNTNGVSGNMIPPQLQQQQAGGGGGMGVDPSVGMINTDIQRAAVRERERQQQIRLAQLASRQLSPQSSQPQPGSIPNVSANAAAGPSSGGGGGGGGGGDLPSAIQALPQPMQQAYRILNTPNHPYIKYMMQNVQGFHTMPLQLQLNKMVSTQTRLQQQREQTHREQMARAMASGGGGGAAGRGGMIQQQQLGDNMAVQQGTQFPVTPASPVHASQNPMFAGQGGGGGGGMDPRMAGMNMNNLNPQQRHMLLMQQQQHQQRNNSGGGGSGGGSQGGMNMNNPQMNMNPMQMNQVNVNPQLAAFQEQQRIRMAQERMALAGAGNPAGGISPTSPDPGAFRSNSTIPGIARSARSPTDASTSISPVHNQTQTSRGGNMGMTQEDYQRMMMQQQQGQAQAMRAMAQSPAFGQQGWGQQQQQERQQQQQQQQFGMSPPGSAVGAPSPPNSQNWNGAQYPFSSSSPIGGGGGGMGEMQQIRHLSATPAPQQQQRQMTPQNTTSPPTIENEADWFNWQ